jgi:hypothetical protein
MLRFQTPFRVSKIEGLQPKRLLAPAQRVRCILHNYNIAFLAVLSSEIGDPEGRRLAAKIGLPRSTRTHYQAEQDLATGP